MEALACEYSHYLLLHRVKVDVRKMTVCGVQNYVFNYVINGQQLDLRIRKPSSLLRQGYKFNAYTCSQNDTSAILRIIDRYRDIYFLIIYLEYKDDTVQNLELRVNYIDKHRDTNIIGSLYGKLHDAVLKIICQYL